MGKIAFVFAGQGAQYSGMGQSLCEVSPAAQAVFDTADKLRPGTSQQCFTAPAEELSITENTQPCLYCVDLAAAKALEEAGVSPDYVAGFSLSPATAKAIEDGYVQLVSEAQPYVMGYFGVVQTVLSKKYGFTGFSIDTGGGIIDATNIGAVSALAQQGLR